MTPLPKRLALFALAAGIAASLWHAAHRAPEFPAAPAADRLIAESAAPAAPDAFSSPLAAAQHVAKAQAAAPTRWPQFDAFNRWTADFVKAQPSAQPALVARGVAVAKARRTVLAQLIQDDPRAALENAVPMVVRQQLPPEVVAQLEERVNARAFFGVLGVAASEKPEPAIRREVRLNDGRRLAAHVFGERLTQQTTEGAFINGIALDRHIAVAERRVRPLEIGEIPDTSKPIAETCPVSQKSTAVERSGTGALPPITRDTPAVEAGGIIHYLCHGGHIIELEEKLTAAEGATGGGIKPTTAIATTTSTGVKTLLYMRLAFPETRLEPQTETAAYDMMRQVNDWFVENSYGNIYIITTVAPLIVLPRTVAWYNGGGGDEYDLRSDALAAAKAMGYDPSSYDLNIVAYSGGPGGFGGLGYVGGAGVWLKSITVGVACHELGHNFGLWHANFWDTGGKSIIGSGSHVEYGNSFDTMGSAGAGNQHYNANHKNQLNWLKKEFVHDIRRSGTYRIYAYDQPALDTANRYAFKVRKDSAREYWGEFRQKYGASNAWLQSGVLLNWSPWAKSAGGAHLLDMTPGSPDAKTDAALTIGRTFSDTDSGIHITPIGKGGTTPESIDVVVNIGNSPGNHAPSVSVTPGQTSFATNAVVSFAATATDTDGDALAYFWDFGDKTFSTDNKPNVTKSWSTAGDYVVRCLVSDMKGQTGSASVLVHAGTSTTYTISGQVTASGQPLANVLVSNGASGSSFRGAYTDSDGRYTITGVAAGSVTLSASLYGYSLTNTFTNPLTAGPNVTGADFTASTTPVVSIVASDPDATEGGDTGKFTITRTGSTTSALTVMLLAASGTATQGSSLDYTLSPSPTYDSTNYWYTVTIPAGQASLDVVLTANDDTSVEGPETATLELMPQSTYAIAGAESATVTIKDTDTSLPQVSIAVVDADASETGDPASFLVSRTGATTSALTVNFTVSGAATNGTDYTSIGTNLTIPAGQSSATLTISPLQDTAVEGDEDVTVTLATNSGVYVLASTAKTASAVITDDDVPTLSVVASDAAASETGQDPGTFLITRTGDTSAALTVNYALTGSALHGVDYVALPGVLTIPAGSATGAVTIVPYDDNIGEPTQTVVLQIRGGTGYVVSPTASNATINITDNDVPVVTVGVSDGTAGEPSDTGTFKFTTTGSGTGNITVHYTVTGTATSGVDFTALSGTLSMGKNTTASVTLTPLNDALLEDLETVTITIDPDPSYTSFLDNSATINLIDDDQPIVSVTATNDAFSETNGSLVKYWISRTGSTAAALTVNYTMSGTATNGTDYQTVSGTVTIPAAAAGVEVDLTLIDDTAKEGTETAILNITPDAAYGIGIGSATQYITDAETPAVSVRFSSGTGTGAESVGVVNVPVTLSAASATTVTVEYAIGGGSAIAGIDYSLTPGVLTFTPGVTSQNIPLTIIDDAFPEPNQTVSIVLKNPNGAALGTSTYSYTITDNDSVPAATVGFASTTSSGVESVSPAQIVVSLSSAQAAAVSVDFAVTGGTAVSGTDFTIAAGTLTFAPGETAKVLPNTILDNTTVQTSRTIILTLSNPSGIALGANATTTYTILDDDASTVSITASDATATEAAGNPGRFTITRSGGIANALTVNLTITGTATNGTDYDAIPTTANFAGGQSSLTIAVTPIDDLLGEGNETVIATIATSSNYTVGSPSSATVTIVDDEPTVSISATDSSAAELGADPGVFTITRSGNTAADLVVNVTLTGTATSGSDYIAPALPITIPAGATTATITITPIDDTAAEGPETVIATIAAGSYAIVGGSTATVTIVDDDVNLAPVINFTSPSATKFNLPAGVGLILEASVSDDGKPLVPGAVTKTWSKQSGPGTVTFGDIHQPTTTATFSTSGSYVLRLTADDGEFQSFVDLTITVGAIAWSGSNVNASTPAGSFSEASGTFTVNGGGANITGTSDQFYFVTQTLAGDGEIRARLVSFSGGAASAKAGVMFRNDTTAGSAAAYMSLYLPSSTNGANSFRTRGTGASYATTTTTGNSTLPTWVRVVRSGNNFSGYTSPDGTTWTQVGSATAIATMNSSPLVGLAVTSNSTAALSTAVFDNVSVISATVQSGPSVDAGPGENATLPTPVNLAGSMSDDGRPTSTLTAAWSKISGPGTVSFADATAPATTATFSAPGNYVLRLIANDGQVKTFDDVAVSAALPSVSVQSIAQAAETGLVPGTFKFTRTGSSDFPLTANFTVAGTATSGVDYTALATSVTFPVGSTTATLDVTPLADQLAEGNETVSVTLANGASYDIGASASATVTIADSPLGSWQMQKFGASANNSAIAGDMADPDGDGLPNLYEYGAGFDPLTTTAEHPQAALSGNDFTLTFRRRIDATDLSYSIEELTAGNAWSPVAFTEEIVSSDGATNLVKAHVPTGGQERKIIRLRVTRN